MAVPFYLPEEGGADDAVLSGGTNPPDGTNNAQSSSQSSPNTTTSATQTPMQSPLLPSDLLMAFYNVLYRYSYHTGSRVFQYPPPTSPSCSAHSPSCTGGNVFFPRSRSAPRIPRTSVSFAAGDEVNFYHQSSSASSSSNSPTQLRQVPQSAPPIPNSHHAHHHYNQHQFCGHYPHYQYGGSSGAGGLHQYTPSSTPTTATTTGSKYSSTSTNRLSGGLAHRNLHRSLSDTTRRSRLTSTGEDEQEYQSEHETSWDEFDDRYVNFTADRESLQEFNGRIPPRKKKKDVLKAKIAKKDQSFTWPAVATLLAFALGCGFLVSR